jgi:hypothetical protein
VLNHIFRGTSSSRGHVREMSSTTYEPLMSHGPILSPVVTQHDRLETCSSDLPPQGKGAWLAFVGRNLASTVFLHCLSGCGSVQSSFARLLFLTSRTICTHRRTFVGSTYNVTTHQLTIPHGCDEISSEPKPRRLSFPPILQMLDLTTSSC